MVEKDKLLKLKISKNAYVFDVRRKYNAKRSFRVKKKPDTPFDDLKGTALSLLKKKKQEKKQEKKPKAPLGAKLPESPKSAIAKTAAIVVLIFILLGAAFVWLMLQGPGAGPEEIEAPDVFSGSFGYSIEQSMVLSSSQEDELSRSAYFLVDFDARNLGGLNFSASVFSQKPSVQVFLLDYARDSADSYPVFRRNLIDKLKENGISVNEIDIEALSSLPGGALVVVPTGYLPKELLGIGSQLDFKKLLSRGVTIVYIGREFDSLALDQAGSAIPVSYNELLFAKSKPESEDGFGLYDAQYVVGQIAGRNDIDLAFFGKIYGSVSVIGNKNGSILFLPQSLDGGWRTDGKAAAQDVVRLITEERWLSLIAYASKEIDLEEEQSGMVSLYSTSFPSDSAYVKFTAKALDLEGNERSSTEVLKLKKVQKGEMTQPEPEAVPYYLSGERTRFNIELRETDPTPVKLYISMYKDGTELQRSDLELGLTNPTIDKSVDFQVNAEPGNYTAYVVNSKGKIYAATRLDVIDLQIYTNSSDWQQGKFTFLLSAAGKPVVPRSLSISLDGKGKRQYTPSSFAYSGTSTAITYEYAGEIKPGLHEFIFTAGDWSKKYEQDYFAAKNFWENPVVIFLAIVSLAVFGIGLSLRRPEVLRYGLDVPDFPPLSTIKIPVKKETVLDILDTVNASYSWKWMPLGTDEIKKGFRKLTYNGKPILIGDFNLDMVLVKLRDAGLVKEELGYWGRAEWEKQSNHSMHYLAMYRILRNVFVNNAVKFSKLDAMNDCDIKAIVGKERLYLHIMEEPKERVVHRALATSGKGKTLIVFRSKDEASSFRSSLTSTSRLAVGLKMEVNSRNILLLPVKRGVSGYLRGLSR